MKKIVCIISCFILITNVLQAQNPEFKLQNFKPTSPSAFDFLKYTEMPVSEYTGIPNIAIPLYEIEEDDVKVPLTLTYHAGGIRVSQEASWVGLGWDLHIGSIVQEVNDEDDYGIGITSILPDYHLSPIPENFPWRYNYPWTHQNGYGWTNPFPINETQPYHSYKVATAWWVPIKGNFDDQFAGEKLFTWSDHDSEPDIFRASFLGHAINFVRDPVSKKIICLNRKDYKILRIDNSYKIIVPSGDEFYFETASTVDSYSSQEGGMGGTGGSALKVSSKVWVLTKIITKNKKQIVFKYTQTPVAENYPSYFEKWTKYTAEGSQTRFANSNDGNHDGYLDLVLGELAKNYSYSKENRLYLSSIEFPKGKIVFTTSERTDLLQGRKLDKIEVSAEKVVKSYDFIYSYFNATNVGGNGFVPFNASTYGSTYKLRLKLQSLQESSGAIHNFTYNATPLPAKNSFAQDYWGFYNGQLSNTNLVPNPVRLKQTHLADNGNNHSAHLASAQAAMLTEIQYPTGGKVALEYELNEFSNYWVPDINTTTNTISTGSGLRIQAISFKEQESAKAKRTLYSYEGGKAAVALQMYRQYPISVIQFGTYQTLETFYRIDELCSKGFFSTNALGSFNGVGYDKVVKKEVDMDGIPSGYTETYFNNTPDIVSNTANGTSHIGATLPAIKNRDNPENGTVKEVRYHKSYYNEQGVLSSKLVKKVVQTYITKYSWQNHPNYEYNYGARIFSYGSLVYKVDLLSQYVKWYPTPLNLIGYYPIYDLWSLPSITTTSEYDEKGNSLVSEKYVIYDDMDQLTMEKVTTSDGRYEEVGYSHPQHDLSNPMYYALYSANRLSEVVKAGKKNTSNVYGDVTELSLFQKEYTWVGSDKIMEHKVTLTNSLSNQTINEVTYDLYDPTNGRLLQMTNKGNVQSMCWGYSGNYLTAEAVNAKASEIFYSSFEEGGWDNNTIGYDNTRSRTGRYSGRIDLSAGGGPEKTSHSTQWLNVSLSGATKFKYSGWVYSTGPQAEIFLFMKRAGESGYSTHSVNTSEINKWTYLEGEYTVPADITQLNIRVDNNGVGSVWFDDIRLHPSSAQMTTYTYEPLIGMTSQTDINNNTIYYEYDGLGRLLHIRDKERNILKKFCYNFQGQVEDCSLNTSPVWVATGQTRCQPCSLNTSYTTNIQQHREVDNNPYSPTYQTAERWVDDGSSGSCSYQDVWQNASPAEIRCETDANGRNTGNQVQRQVNLNPCSPNTERWVVIGTNTTACTLPQDYARLSYENTMHYASYSSADVQVSFYANSQGTTPTTVTGLDVHYASQHFCNWSGSYVQSCSGTAQVLEYGAWIYYLNDNWYCPPGELCPSPDCYVDWFLESGTGYSIIY